MTREPTTGARTVLLRSALPDGPHVSQGLPAAETAAFVAVLPLLSVPVLLASMGATWAMMIGVAGTALVGWLCLARRTVVGAGWLADRRLWRYRVTSGEHLQRVELVANGHGGLLELHTEGGRAHRLRESDFRRPETRAALAELVGSSPAVLCPASRSLLGLPAAA